MAYQEQKDTAIEKATAEVIEVDAPGNGQEPGDGSAHQNQSRRCKHRDREQVGAGFLASANEVI
jgi:hypothetical protein